MIFLDTNILSELIGDRPDSSVADWLKKQDPNDLRISAVVAMELRFGAAILPEGRRRSALCADIEDVLEKAFDGAIVAFDEVAASIYADLAARLRRSGIVIGQSGMMIAATALQFGATIATRNVKHFQPCGVAVANPIEGP